MRIRITFVMLLALAAFLGFSIQAEAQGNLTWQAEYYSNPYLLEPTVLERQDANIAFNWGAASPGQNVPADNFSVRWATRTNLQGGEYRFYVLADEEVSVAIDFLPAVITTLGESRIGEIITADVELAPGEHQIQVDYREYSGDAYIFFSFESLADGASGPDFALPPSNVPDPVIPSEGSWTANYYANTSLAATPILTRQEATPQNNWGAGSPSAVVPVDNWSARWTRNISLTQGIYRVTVSADDGVRVYVDNTRLIDEWHVASAETYSADITLTSGVHTFVVEFYEGGGLAFLSYSLSALNPFPVIPPQAATATIITGQLNVRSQPELVAGEILTRVNYGEMYVVLAFNASQTWVQINVNGIVGWVNRNYVRLANAGTLPIVGVSTPQPTGYFVTADPYSVNIRNGPGTSFDDLGNLPAGSTVQVVGRNAENTWWQIDYNGITGWVSGVYAIIDSGVNLSLIPITG